MVQNRRVAEKRNGWRCPQVSSLETLYHLVAHMQIQPCSAAIKPSNVLLHIFFHAHFLLRDLPSHASGPSVD